MRRAPRILLPEQVGEEPPRDDPEAASAMEGPTRPAGFGVFGVFGFLV